MYPSFLPQQPQQAPYNPERQAHVSDLVSHLPSFKQVSESAFEGPARLADGRSTTLRITLPTNFPQVRPLLTLSQPIQHRLVGPSGQVNLPSLAQWGPRSRLSATVREALESLSAKPAHSANSSPTKAATAPTDFPGLQTLSTQQLEQLLTDKEAFDRMVATHADKAQSIHVNKLLARGNVELAQANLDREAEVAEIKNQIAIIRSSEYATAKETFEDAYARQEAVLRKIKPAALIQALAEKAAEVDESAEALFARFMAKEVAVEAFLPSYIALKKQYHQRELKRQAAEQIL